LTLLRANGVEIHVDIVGFQRHSRADGTWRIKHPVKMILMI
jgi:hypothetical protein